jgi:DNA-binding response OmpR family regulator
MNVMEMGGKTVMLVDDEEAILASLTDYLERNKLSVTAATSGEDAMALFRAKPVDMVVTDLVMPGMSGIDVLKEIKECNRGTGVFILTGKGSIDLAVQALRLGADDFIEKPFDVEELLLKMAKIFEKQAALKKAFIYEKILPICSYCKKIRDDRGTERGRGKWLELEEYLWQMSGTTLSHGCCPECYGERIKEWLLAL